VARKSATHFANRCSAAWSSAPAAPDVAGAVAGRAPVAGADGFAAAGGGADAQLASNAAAAADAARSANLLKRGMERLLA
jgi:hypothetical protein